MELTEDFSTNIEGKKYSHIHNPTIHYYRQIMAHSIFGRGDNGSVNCKELFFINCVFKSTPFHSVTFILTHIGSVSNAKRGVIGIGGLITSISHTLHLDAKLATLVPLTGSTTLDMHSCQA